MKENKENKSRECPLCNIPLNESLLYEDNNIYLVSTKELKGHKVRVMVATKRHTKQPSFIEQITADAFLVKYMNNVMQGQDWYIVDSTYATVPEHWHLIACDFPLEEESDPLFEKTSKVHFPLQSPKVLIGIPAYNEEKTIHNIIQEAKNYGDIVVVDDGSTDSTSSIAYHSGAHVHKHHKNLGYGISITELFCVAKEENYDILITLDADGQHSPFEIPNFLKAIKASDIVIGNRFKSQSSNTPTYRKLGIKTLSKLSSLKDSQCGFRAYSKRAIHTIYNKIFERGMGASVEILKVAQANELKIVEIPCTIKYENTKHSQYPISHGLDVLKAFFWSIIWEKPTKYLAPLGVFFLFTTLVSLVQVINLYVQSHYVVTTWALLTMGSLICTFLIFNTLTLILIFKNRKVKE